MPAILRKEWFPCTAGLSIEEHLSLDDSSPFLQPLARQWINAGQPFLTSLGELQMSTGYETIPLSLSGLANQQVASITDLVLSALQSSASIDGPRSFESFAAQLNLYSSIRADLFGLPYDQVWQNVLKNMDHWRSQNCSQHGTHVCLGQILFGESCWWPLETKRKAFQCYTTDPQTSKLQLIPNLIQSMQIGKAWSSGTGCVGDDATNSTPASATTDEIMSPSTFTMPLELARATGRETTNTQSGNALFSLNEMVNTIVQAREPASSEISNISTLPSWLNAELEQKVLLQNYDLGNSLRFTNNIADDIPQFYGQVHADTARAVEHALLLPPYCTKTEVEQKAESGLLTTACGLVGTSCSLPSFSATVTLSGASVCKRPQMRKRSSTLSSNGSQQCGRSIACWGEPTPFTSRLRSQRHYYKLLAQRHSIIDILTEIQNQTSLLRIDQATAGDTYVKIIKSLLEEAEVASCSNLMVSALKDAPSDPNKRKRDSKKKIRNADIRNITLLSSIAGLLIEVPLPRLLVQVGRSVRTSAGYNVQETDKEHLNSSLAVYIDIWLAFRLSWPDLLAAEKRLFQDMNSSEKLIATFIGLLQIAHDKTSLGPDQGTKSF